MRDEPLLQDLTESQRQAVQHTEGPLLIVAGAGSGKTRVITRRVAYLVSLGIEPASILAITFTNKAAGEMKSRISAALSRPLRDFGQLEQTSPMICTFHSLCLRILKHYASQLGLPPNFTIFDSADQTKVLKEALKSLDISITNFPPSSVHSAISNAKNKLLTPESFAQSATDYYSRNVAKIYTKYQKLLRQNNALDFDDLLMRTAHAFRDHPGILAELQTRFQYVMIDEYQDTNHAQYILAHALALRHKNICVVGDPDQSIYAWRGADIQNILDFEKDYPSAKVVRLEQNYRSTKTILQIASHLIDHNTQRRKKTLWTENPQGEKAVLFLCHDEYDEAQAIARQLKELHDKAGYEWNQMAVFYRINALSRVMEDALRRAELPYQIARGVEFYGRKEIKDVLAYLRVIVNPDDEVSLTRIVNVPPRGMGDTSIRQMQTYAIAHGLTLWQAMEQVSQIAGLTTRAVNATRQFVQLVQRWRVLAAKPVSPDDVLSGAPGKVRSVMEDVVRTSGMEQTLKKIGEKEQEELSNVGELITAAAEYDSENPEGSLEDYIARVSLVSDADRLEGSGGAITLMTLHAAKGLEFPVVAMIGLEEGILPHSRARDNANELEEERRLCFVGITRAEQRLLLSKGLYRTFRGLRERTIGSPFLTEMPPDSLTVIDRTATTVPESRTSLHHRPLTQFAQGQLVRHPKFGLGRIEDISGFGSNTKAIIHFNQDGRKTLVLEYARLEPAE